MNLSITFALMALPALNAFAPTPLHHSSTTIARRSSSPLRVSNVPKDAKQATDLAADFESTNPEDILANTEGGDGAQVGQAEVVLVGCGAPNRGMGWYHAIQMLEGR